MSRPGRLPTAGIPDGQIAETLGAGDPLPGEKMAPGPLTAGARVPSRQASRYLDGSPLAVLVDLGAMGALSSTEGAQIEAQILEGGQEVRLAPPPGSVLDTAWVAAEREARLRLERRREKALERLMAHAEAEEERLVAAGFNGGATRKAIETALAALRAHRTATEEALRQVKLELDAAAIVVP